MIVIRMITNMPGLLAQISNEIRKNPFTESKVRRVHWIIITKLILVINRVIGCWRSVEHWSEEEENNNYHLHIKSYTLKVLIEISFYYSDNEKPCTDYNIMWPPFFNTRKCIYMFFFISRLIFLLCCLYRKNNNKNYKIV